jgi:hypothetical protein
MNPRLLTFALLIAAVALSTIRADEPLRIENKTYSFAFTFAPGTELAYEEDGVGISGSHIPDGKKKPDYGVLVYGSPGMLLSAAEATAIEYADHEAVLSAVDVVDHAEWVKTLAAIMRARGHQPAGEAVVRSGKSELKIPYYTWKQELLGRTHHALMYVLKHALQKGLPYGSPCRCQD